MFFLGGLVSSSVLYALIFALSSTFGFNEPSPWLGIAVAYLVIKTIQNIAGVFLFRRHGAKRDRFLLYYVTAPFLDFTNPFRGLASLRLLKGTTRADLRVPWKVYNRFEVVLHFLWSITLWVVFIVGLAGLLLSSCKSS